MKILPMVNHVLDKLKLNRVMSVVADKLVPSLDAEAGLITCWKSEKIFCGSCVYNGGDGAKRNYYASPSSQCSLGWPICSGCNWVYQYFSCESC